MVRVVMGEAGLNFKAQRILGLTGADGEDLLNKYLDLKSEQNFGPQSESHHTKIRRNELSLRVKCMIVRFVHESFRNHFQRGRGGQSGHGRSRPKFESYNLKKLCSEIHRKNYNRDWKARVDLICEMMCELFRSRYICSRPCIFGCSKAGVVATTAEKHLWHECRGHG